MQVKELVKRGWPGEEVAGLVIHRQRKVYSFNNEAVTNAQALVGWFVAKLRIHECTSSGKTLIAMVQSIKPEMFRLPKASPFRPAPIWLARFCIQL